MSLESAAKVLDWTRGNVYVHTPKCTSIYMYIYKFIYIFCTLGLHETSYVCRPEEVALLEYIPLFYRSLEGSSDSFLWTRAHLYAVTSNIIRHMRRLGHGVPGCLQKLAGSIRAIRQSCWEVSCSVQGGWSRWESFDFIPAHTQYYTCHFAPHGTSSTL